MNKKTWSSFEFDIDSMKSPWTLESDDLHPCVAQMCSLMFESGVIALLQSFLFCPGLLFPPLSDD